MSKKILEVFWFTAGNCTIGVVVLEDSVTREHKAYIGQGRGIDEDADALFIAEQGAKILPETLDRIRKYFPTGAK
jgi:hypothetical protein